MAGLAIITGASSGLGREFAILHAKRGGDVIITARREAELQALKAELERSHKITAHVVAADLGTPEGIDAVCACASALDVVPSVLINNAGFGGQGRHIDRDLEVEQAMIDLNVKSLVALSHRIGRQMAAAGRGRILNVGSTAGFVPGPNQAVYFATKAFVNSFSQALDQELRPQGVTCTVLAPGYVETGFAAAADLEGTEMVNAGGAQAAAVARLGYAAMGRGKLVVINDRRLAILLRWINPFVPRRMLLKAVARSQSK